MASRDQAGTNGASNVDFGIWLRQAREERGLMQRQVAAAAEMDQSHYAKIESGRKYPKPVQAAAIAQCLGLDEMEFRQRQKAAEILELCEGDHALAHGAAGLVREEAAPYRGNKSVSKPVKKPRTRS